MGKITKVFIVSLLILSLSALAWANQSVIITAYVGNINHAPVIKSINPADDPRLLKRDKIQKYIIYFTDDEKNPTNYTITSSYGYNDPVSGVVSNFDSGSGAYINFTYKTPSTKPLGNMDKITVTLDDSSDGSNLVTKDLNIYVY